MSADQCITCKDNPIAVLETNMGTIEIEVFLDRMPLTGSNFVDLCRSGFYEGLHFHRVIAGFMCQFGCPHSRNSRAHNVGTGNPPPGFFPNLKTGRKEVRDRGGNIQDEFISKISNRPGTLSMANTGQPNSGGSQFFLNVAHNSTLDYWEPPKSSQHPVFGKVVKNYELCQLISKVQTQNDNPINPIRMNKVSVKNNPSDEALAPFYARIRASGRGDEVPKSSLAMAEKVRQDREAREAAERAARAPEKKREESGEKKDDSRSRGRKEDSREKGKDRRGRDDSRDRDRRRRDDDDSRDKDRDRRRRRDDDDSREDKDRRRRDDSRDRDEKKKEKKSRKRDESEESRGKDRRRRDEDEDKDRDRRRRRDDDEDRDRRRRDEDEDKKDKDRRRRRDDDEDKDRRRRDDDDEDRDRRRRDDDEDKDRDRDRRRRGGDDKDRDRRRRRDE